MLHDQDELLSCRAWLDAVSAAAHANQLPLGMSTPNWDLELSKLCQPWDVDLPTFSTDSRSPTNSSTTEQDELGHGMS
jgi:hypothetical protein